MQRKLNSHGDLLTNEENLSQGKNPTGWFASHHSQESLIKNQAVTSIRNFTTTLDYPKIPTYNWTFTPISNWTWSCREFFLCADLSTWLTSQQLMFVIGCKFLHFNTCWRFESTWLQNPKANKYVVYNFSKSVWVL